jgi:uncharacterized protein YdhG (YjbR/CyaY superfamily)
MNSTAADVDAYIAAAPEPARAALQALRRTINAAAPEAVESIAYGMAGYKYRGKPLVYFAALKNHCALYGTAAGTLRFAPDQPPPEERVQDLIRQRIAAIEAVEAERRSKRAGTRGTS